MLLYRGNMRGIFSKEIVNQSVHKPWTFSDNEHPVISHKNHLVKKTIVSFLVVKQLFQFRFLD